MVGPAEGHLPDGTGFNPYGIWLQEIDYKALGYPPPPESKRATTWGPVRIGSEEERSLISFLKSFRYIVETAESLDQMLSELKELSTIFGHHCKILQKTAKLKRIIHFLGDHLCKRGLAKKTNDLQVHIVVEFNQNPSKVPGGASIPSGFYKTISSTKLGLKECFYFKNSDPGKNKPFNQFYINCN
jgi:hypothetical protein